MNDSQSWLGWIPCICGSSSSAPSPWSHDCSFFPPPRDFPLLLPFQPRTIHASPPTLLDSTHVFAHVNRHHPLLRYPYYGLYPVMVADCKALVIHMCGCKRSAMTDLNPPFFPLGLHHALMTPRLICFPWCLPQQLMLTGCLTPVSSWMEMTISRCGVEMAHSPSIQDYLPCWVCTTTHFRRTVCLLACFLWKGGSHVVAIPLAPPFM